MDRWSGKIAVVTGASAGIGLEITKNLLQKGMIVVGLARRKEKMEAELANFTNKFHAVKCDIANHNDVTEAFEWIRKNVGKVQVIVNNAAILVQGRITQVDNDTLKSIMDVNVMGTVYCTKEAIKIMEADKLEGHIININAVLGHSAHHLPPTIHFNLYTASKFAITGFSQTLLREVLGHNIRVTSISPGLVKTEMALANVDQLPHLEVADIAEAVLYALGTSSRVQITELTLPPLGAL